MTEDAASVQTTETPEAPTDLGFLHEKSHLSFSQLSTYSGCGEKYRLSYIERVPRRPQGPFIAGIAVHEAIATSEDEGWWEDEANADGPTKPIVAEFLERFDDGVAKAGGRAEVRWGGRGGSEDVEWWHHHGELMMRRYANIRRSWAGEGWGSIGTEYRVVVTLPGLDRPVIGYLDKFLMHEGGEPLIVDWKTGKVGGADPLQFATYAEMIAQARGIEVRRAVAVYLRAATMEQGVQEVSGFAALRERVGGEFATLAKAIEADLFTVNPQSYCSSCSVNAHCWYWQAKEGAEG